MIPSPGLFLLLARLRPARAALVVATLVAGASAARPGSGAAQSVLGIERDLLEAVMPGADRFGPRSGNPPVMRAWHGEDLLGFVFRTEDVPPEQHGYSGPVQAVVGLLLDGTISGARVTEYYESYRSSMGDFLRDPGVQEQFRGKHLADPFQVNGDVERVTRATISTQALARGIRDGARRVAAAYADEMGVVAEAGPLVLEELSWYEMQTRGVLKRVLIEGDEGHLDISMVHLPDDSVAAFFLGEDDVARIHAQARRVGLVDPAYVMYALAGPRLRYFLREGWYVAQEGDTLALSDEQVYNLGVTDAGRVESESTLAGVFLLDDRVDRTRPFSLLYDFEAHEGYYAADFGALALQEGAEEAGPVDAGEGARAAADRAPRSSPNATPEMPADQRAPAVERPGALAAAPGEGGGGEGVPGPDAPDGPTAGASDDAAAPQPAPTADRVPHAAPPPPAPAANRAPSTTTPHTSSPPPSANATPNIDAPATPAPSDAAPTTTPENLPPSPTLAPLDLAFSEEGSELERTLARTDWARMGRLTVIVLLALAAFFLKIPALRYASLAATLVVLGFADGGFLSVSHLTAGIWVGPRVYVQDLGLLVLGVVTLATTLIWGRVFCGFLCPFGALQDFMERLVPTRFRVRVPWAVHLPALKVKYLVLAAILLPALLGSRTSLYQYAEPFGTVFFLSPSLLLWSIAGLFLLGAAVVPRFYCRYACPLGAGLALLSWIAPGRIGRVEQCEHCAVCERDCPTGAIRWGEVDFVECVRCNRCETHLLRGAGACGHDMETIRPRLVQLEVGAGRGRHGV